MSDELPFYVDRAKGGRAACKGCKQKCLDGELRMAKVVPSPYGEGKMMKSWYHVDCMMNMFLKQRVTTKRIDSPSGDIGNWYNISQADQNNILDKLKELEGLLTQKYGDKYIKPAVPLPAASTIATTSHVVPAVTVAPQPPRDNSLYSNHKDNSFREFRRLCSEITCRDAYTAKTAVVKKLFKEGTDGQGFKGDLVLWCRLLLPGAVKRVYNLKSKQLVKLFSRIFNVDHDDMLTHLENGDVAETIGLYHEKSYTPAKKSLLTLHQVDEFLERLTTMTKEDEQIHHFKFILPRCTSNDLRLIIRLIKGDLRLNAGAKHILEGVHSDAYTLFQSSRDIESVIARVTKQGDSKDSIASPIKTSVKADVMIMTPVLPMLAEACKSVEMAMKKCPNGMFSEIKYDGERVQLHKRGNDFKYYSRALKPVMPHKINRFKDFIPKAFPHGKDLILDAEVLMIDTKTGKPLPFGSLGIHKKTEFKDAEVCLFVFDCIYLNGEVLTQKPMRERRKILEDNMIEIKNHVMFSEMELINKPGDLAKMIAKVLQLGLEGLVLKDLESKYEPGKRHWLKVKKDYLFDGAMADSADLVVLGAWFGTGKKGGMLSVFLMGCYDKFRDVWLTVTKVHTGHDDKTLEDLQEPLKNNMLKISRDTQKVPSWIRCTNTMVPDFIAKDPKKQPVWEITGTELTQAQIHTADGISVRFPRVTRIRDDKNWETATNLEELKILYKNSKEHTDVSLLNKIACQNEGNDVEDKVVKLEKDDSGKRCAIDRSESTPRKKLFTDSMNDMKLDKKIPIDDLKCETKVKIETQYHPEKTLPNIFNDISIAFHPNEEKSENLKRYKRYWIANGGQIDSSQPTHVIHYKDSVSIAEFNKLSESFPKVAKHVHIKWLEECLECKKCVDTREHRVALKK